MTRERALPKPWDTDWLMLRGIARALDKLITDTVEPGSTVLDFGCGDMPYRYLVEARGATYWGADFGEAAAIPISANGTLPLADASADIVISVQVLEHVGDLDTYFSEIARVLKQEGILLLSTHGAWLYHPHPEDYRRWTRTGLVRDIEIHSFKVREIEAIVGPLATTTIIRLTGYAFFLRRLPVIGRLLASLLVFVMNVRAWLEEKATPEKIRADNGCIYMTRCQRVAA